MKRLISCFLISVSILLLSCSEYHSSSVSESIEGTGTLKLTVNMSRSGKLAKVMKLSTITLKTLIIKLSAEGQGTIIDTIALSGGSLERTKRITYGNLEAFANGDKIEWTLAIKAEDGNGRVIYMGDTIFTLIPTKTTDVSLSLLAKYSMLVAHFFPIRDSVTQCEIIIDTDDEKADSSFDTQSLLGDTVKLSYDYMTASPSGIEHYIELKAYGDSSGKEILLYSGDTTILVKSGEDTCYQVHLRYMGMDTLSGAAAMTVSLGVGGTTTVDGVMDADTQWNPPAGMVKIAAEGKTFSMGSTEGDEDEEPVHQVTFTEDFWMDTTEVTQGKYEALMSATYSGFTAPSWRSDYGTGDDYPAYYVNWYDAALYCNARTKAAGSSDTVYVYESIAGTPGNDCALNELIIDMSKGGFRLPTEAEWEYACRAGTTTEYYWGSDSIGKYAWYNDNSSSSMHPVALKVKNGFGLYGMSGNVREWCNDWYGAYPDSSVVDPQGPPKGDYRVLRGGSWGRDARSSRSADRNGYDPGFCDFFGFRLSRGQ